MILLAIDLGTEGARVGAFTSEGEPLGSVAELHEAVRTFGSVLASWPR